MADRTVPDWDLIDRTDRLLLLTDQTYSLLYALSEAAGGPVSFIDRAAAPAIDLAMEQTDRIRRGLHALARALAHSPGGAGAPGR